MSPIYARDRLATAAVLVYAAEFVRLATAAVLVYAAMTWAAAKVDM